MGGHKRYASDNNQDLGHTCLPKPTFYSYITELSRFSNHLLQVYCKRSHGVPYDYPISPSLLIVTVVMEAIGMLASLKHIFRWISLKFVLHFHFETVRPYLKHGVHDWAPALIRDLANFEKVTESGCSDPSPQERLTC